MRRLGVLFFTASAVTALVAPGRAAAHEFYVGRVPNPVQTANSVGIVRPCINCHNNPDGGDGCVPTGGTAPCLNPFGLAFRANSFVWNATLAGIDSDMDGFSNGEELQDPGGMWRPGAPSMPGVPAYHTAPGFRVDDPMVCAPLATGMPFRTGCSSPGMHDADHDGYCYYGYDADHSGTCDGLSATEHPPMAFDCDDSMSAVSSAATEDCTNLVDDDCNGLDTLHDPACVSVIDGDGDGWCPTGHDLNGDRNCLGAGEAMAVVDCDDTRINVHPMARENCTDGVDNDCNGFIDLADAMCTGTDDVDGDGFCPIGEDLNHNGSCLDPGEQATGLADCDDTMAAISPAATEDCTDGIDNDCNGFVDRMDAHCGAFLDTDSDSYCPQGRDMNADGDCLDAGESTAVADCNDTDAMVHPGALEDCLGSVDHDCNGLVGLADPMCAGYLDADHDGYCFVGYDRNHDGDCADAMETGGAATDCNDGDPLIGPAAAEVCTDGLDNNCNGSVDAHDSACAHDYLDFDHDHWCVVGEDMNADGDCDDAGEQAGPADADPHDPTVNPSAHENCYDHKDNDQDGTTDLADSDCMGTAAATDADHDGYCPVGQDLNGDGDCLDGDEPRIVLSDCDDTNAMIGPGNRENTRPTCTDFVDNDCDSDVDLADLRDGAGSDVLECALFLDLDGDGFCPMGVDDTGNGQCLDEGEDRFGMDCNDANAMISPHAIESCTNGVDDDCDGLVDLYDPQCNCLMAGASCDDHDPCTIDTCGTGGGLDGGSGADGGPPACVHLHDTTCDDAGTPDAGVARDGATGGDGGAPDGGAMPHGGGCCRVGGAGRADGALGVSMLALLALFARAKRRRHVGGGR